MIGIYKITINGKNYIGQSTNILERWRQHLYRGFNNTTDSNNDAPLYKAMRQYGIENVSFTILEQCTIDQLDEREEYYNRLFQAYETGFNQSYSYGANSLTQNTVLKIINSIINEKEKTLQEIANENNTSVYIVKAISRGDSHKQPDLIYPLRGNNWGFFCQLCGEKISSGHKYCKSCSAQLRAEKQRDGYKKPSKEDLQLLAYDYTFTEIGKQFNVNRTTVGKWLAAYNLPHTKKEIQKYTKEEWLNL